LELDPSKLPDQSDNEKWPAMKELFAAKFASKTRDEWCKIFDGTDACVGKNYCTIRGSIGDQCGY
jgi:alpha-methylacyl-CoA racemase